MTSLIRNLKNERKKNKYSYKLEGKILCTTEATETKEAIFSAFPIDIGIIKRISNAKIINTRLKKAQDEYYLKHKYIPGDPKTAKALQMVRNESMKILMGKK